MKTCIRCHIPQPLEHFGNYARYPDGKHRYCQTCWNGIAEARRRAKGMQPVPPFLERLWGNIAQCGHEERACLFCCWPWLKKQDKDGYGCIGITNQGKTIHIHVHRVVYELWHAVHVPPELSVCHYCDVPICCNPLHLWLGTWNDNRQDCVIKGRQAKGDTSGWRTHPEAFRIGIASPRAKLTAEGVRAIRLRYAQGGVTAQALASEYGISKFAALQVIRRRTYKDVM